MEGYSVASIYKDTRQPKTKPYLKVFTYSCLAVGIFLFALTLILDQTQNGAPVLRLFSRALDVRVLCAVLWLTGIAGLFGVSGQKKGRDLVLVTAAAFLAMLMCMALAGYVYALVIYIITGVLIISAKRMGYSVGAAVHAVLIFSYVALPLAFIFMDMLQSPYLYNTFALVANPGLDPKGAGYLYLTVRQLLEGAQLSGQSLYLTDAGLQLDRVIGPSMHNYALIRIVSGYGWLAGIAVLSVLCLIISFLLIAALKIENRSVRCISISCALFLAIQLILGVLGNLALLPETLTCRLPLFSGIASDILCNLFLVANIILPNRAMQALWRKIGIRI